MVSAEDPLSGAPRRVRPTSPPRPRPTSRLIVLSCPCSTATALRLAPRVTRLCWRLVPSPADRFVPCRCYGNVAHFRHYSDPFEASRLESHQAPCVASTPSQGRDLDPRNTPPTTAGPCSNSYPVRRLGFGNPVGDYLRFSNDCSRLYLGQQDKPLQGQPHARVLETPTSCRASNSPCNSLSLIVSRYCHS